MTENINKLFNINFALSFLKEKLEEVCDENKMVSYDELDLALYQMNIYLEQPNEEKDEQILEEQEDGTLRWSKNGVLHREENLPAMIVNEKFESKMLFAVDGKLHRTDGPAYLHVKKLWIEDERDYEEVSCSIYYENGQIHRDNGPAIRDMIRGEIAFYRRGFLHKTDGPAVSTTTMTVWYIGGQRHRIDGPAFISPKGKSWWINGKRHREDGPAVEYSNGNKEWWSNGVWLKSVKK